MYVVDLECCNEHKFEGWYDDRQEYDQIVGDGELTCPLCETHDVRRVLTTGAAKTSKTRERQERRNEIPVYEYVGKSFADRAIGMVEGREPKAPIAGLVTEEDEERLAKKGIKHYPVTGRDALSMPDDTEIH
jgi:hypothetical protein